MTIVMQSSTAAAATTLVALNAGSLSFEQGCAMIVGQSIGTAATTALVVIGGGLAVRRSALAHIIFSSIVGILGMVFLGPLAAAAEWVGARLDDPDGVLALAAFSSHFQARGHRCLLSVDRSFRPVHRPDLRNGQRVGRQPPRSGAGRCGRAIALEAAWRAILEVARGAVDAVRRRLAGEPSRTSRRPRRSSRSSTSSNRSRWRRPTWRTIGPRLVRLCHALDHLTSCMTT